MSYLLHLDACLAFAKNAPRVVARMQHYAGALQVTTVTLYGFGLWLLAPKTPGRYMQSYSALMQQATALALDRASAERAAQLNSRLGGGHPRVTHVDFLVAGVALEHHLTLVTQETARFSQIPGLALADWMVP